MVPFLTSIFVDLFANVYGFCVGIGGLGYIGIGLGFVLSALIGAHYMDILYAYVRIPFHPHLGLLGVDVHTLQLIERNGGKGKPELRIPTAIPGSLLIPIGLLCVPGIISIVGVDY
jgi:hypothetical protein